MTWEDVTGDAGDLEPEPAPSAPDWEAGTRYDTGALVTYQGTVYRCIQEHVTQAGWEPPNVPALWARA